MADSAPKPRIVRLTSRSTKAATAPATASVSAARKLASHVLARTKHRVRKLTTSSLHRLMVGLIFGKSFYKHFLAFVSSRCALLNEFPEEEEEDSTKLTTKKWRWILGPLKACDCPIPGFTVSDRAGSCGFAPTRNFGAPPQRQSGRTTFGYPSALSLQPTAYEWAASDNDDYASDRSSGAEDALDGSLPAAATMSLFGIATTTTTAAAGGLAGRVWVHCDTQRALRCCSKPACIRHSNQIMGDAAARDPLVARMQAAVQSLGRTAQPDRGHSDACSHCVTEQGTRPVADCNYAR